MTQRISFQDLTKGFMDGLMKTEFYLKNSGLDLKLQELIKYKVSQINGCAYCLDMHHKEAIHLGETEQRLYSLITWKECPYYSDKERAVLAFTEVLTHVREQGVDDAIYDTLSAFFSKTEIANIALAIAQINSWNRINITFRTLPGTYKVA